MKCQELAARVESLDPTAEARDVARLCLLLSNSVESLSDLSAEEHLTQTWKDVGMRLQMATDQHAAMTEELENLARTDPQKFAPEQIWILVRAIKVQSQILQMYVGTPALDV